MSGKSGKLSCRMLITEGPDTGLSISWGGSLSDNPKAVEITNKALVAMGYDFASDSSIVNNLVSIVIDHDTYSPPGKAPQTRARVRFVNDPSGGGGNYQPMAPSMRAAALGRLKLAAIATKQVKSALPKAPFEDEMADKF
jgi:hypothetical protein